ncbi:zinc transporter ZntB [Sphingomonas quercus]|uniref:Zinc transporter ZntB n=1 Tax=Sphingomonas quercus TaxID=2842451 RepID=A0ABS6BF30_9SPHN|nr:zinc transporter ZntB [Sphingomonas quercus]MBU3076907.1 zinc transporter ZntB [Sphingomonas quercus]
MIGCGYVVHADGTVAECGVAGAPQHSNDDKALVWVHLDGRDPESRAWLEKTDLPRAALEALTAEETRPRADVIHAGAILNLRGLATQGVVAPDALVSIRLWAEKGRVISVSFFPLAAVQPVRAAMEAGRIRDPGDLITAIAVTITEALDPDVAALGDTLDEFESDMLRPRRGLGVRARIGKARSRAILYRRFVAPQRAALERLAGLEVDWLEDDDRSHVRVAADRFARMAEELEAIRERAALMHEQLTDLRAELVEQRALLVSVVALIFLPLTFITGLLGMNVDGIPYAHHPHAFWWVTGFCVAVAVGVTGYFVMLRWFRE